MTRKLFLTLMIAFTILNLAHNEISIYRVNDVSDRYLIELMKNSVLVGCVLPTQDYEYCREAVERVEETGMLPEIKRVSEDINDGV